WVWVFNENTAGSPGRILTENPDWANKNKKGEIVSYHNSTWLSPARKDVRDYLQERYVYLVENYDLDGLNLDYIRFPEEYRGSFGYDSVSVEKFKEEFELDPFEIKSGSSEFAIWNQYREDLITKMVRETSQKLKAAEPDLLISADVIPGREEARYRALQNWSYWLQESYIDFVLPMTYTENLFSELSRWVKEDRDEIAGPLYAGISVFKLSPEQVISQIEEINQINPNGLSLLQRHI
ncbi:MAG: glycoside hydrolase family 10 protein, partial [Halanaerobium sp.]